MATSPSGGSERPPIRWRSYTQRLHRPPSITRISRMGTRNIRPVPPRSPRPLHVRDHRGSHSDDRQARRPSRPQGRRRAGPMVLWRGLLRLPETWSSAGAWRTSSASAPAPAPDPRCYARAKDGPHLGRISVCPPNRASPHGEHLAHGCARSVPTFRPLRGRPPRLSHAIFAGCIKCCGSTDRSSVHPPIRSLLDLSRRINILHLLNPPSAFTGTLVAIYSYLVDVGQPQSFRAAVAFCPPRGLGGTRQHPSTLEPTRRKGGQRRPRR